MTKPSSDTEPETAGQAHQELSSIPMSTVFPENDSNFGTMGHHENGNPGGQPTNAMHISASLGTSIQHACFLDSKPSSYAPIDYDAPFDSIPDPILDNDDDGIGDLADVPPLIGSTTPSIHPPVNSMSTFPLGNEKNGIDTLAYTMPSSYLLEHSDTLITTSPSNPYSAQFGLSSIDLNGVLAGTTRCPQTGPIPATASGNNDNDIVGPTDMILYQPSHQFENTSWSTGHQTPWVENLTTPQVFTHWDPLLSSAAQPTALLPEELLHPSAAIPPPLSLPGAPQDSRHNELISQSRSLSTSKRTSDDQSPRRPEKRTCPIRPKLTPAQPGPPAITLETDSGSRKRRAIKDKHSGVPADMMNTFQKDGPATSDALVPRIRSKKVCLRCQTLREKCSGTFPCQNCGPSNVRCTGRATVYHQLPCFDADPEDLDPFCILADFHLALNPDLPLPDIATHINDLLKASAALCLPALESLSSNADGGRVSALFSFFTLTELPAGEVFVGSLRGLPDLLQWKPERVLPAPEVVYIPIALALLFSITQTRALVRLTGSPRYDLDVCSAALSTILFTTTKVLLEKVRRRKASPAEQETLHSNLLVLLFLSSMRSTYVLRAAQETFVQILYKEHIQSTRTAKKPVVISATIFSGHPFLIDAVSLLIDYTQSWSRRKELFGIWTRHWLHKLYGDHQGKEILSKTGLVLELCTLLSSMDSEPELIGQEATCERDGFADGGDRADSVPSIPFQFVSLPNGPADFAEGEDTNPKAPAIETVAGTNGLNNANLFGLGLVQSLMMAVQTPGQSSLDEETLRQNLDYMVGVDIPQLLAPGPQPQLSHHGAVFKALKKGIILDYKRGGGIGTSEHSAFRPLRDKMQEQGHEVSSDAEWYDFLFSLLVLDFIKR